MDRASEWVARGRRPRFAPIARPRCKSTPWRTSVCSRTEIQSAVSSMRPFSFTLRPGEVRLPVFLGTRDQVGVNRLHLFRTQPITEALHALLLELAAQHDIPEFRVLPARKITQVLDPAHRILAVADGALL